MSAALVHLLIAALSCAPNVRDIAAGDSMCNGGVREAAIEALTRALVADPSLLEARVNLALVDAKSACRAVAAAAAANSWRGFRRRRHSVRKWNGCSK